MNDLKRYMDKRRAESENLRKLCEERKPYNDFIKLETIYKLLSL